MSSYLNEYSNCIVMHDVIMNETENKMNLIGLIWNSVVPKQSKEALHRNEITRAAKNARQRIDRSWVDSKKKTKEEYARSLQCQQLTWKMEKENRMWRVESMRFNSVFMLRSYYKGNIDNTRQKADKTKTYVWILQKWHDFFCDQTNNACMKRTKSIVLC